MTEAQHEALDAAVATMAARGGNAGDVCARPPVRASLEVLAARSDPGDLRRGAELWAIERGGGVWSPEELRETYEAAVGAATRERQARGEQGRAAAAEEQPSPRRGTPEVASWPATDEWGLLWVALDRKIRGTAPYVDVPRDVIERCRGEKNKPLADCVRTALAAWALEHEGPSPDVPGALRFRRTRVLRGPMDDTLCLTAKDRRRLAREEQALKAAESAGKEQAA